MYLLVNCFVDATECSSSQDNTLLVLVHAIHDGFSTWGLMPAVSQGMDADSCVYQVQDESRGETTSFVAKGGGMQRVNLVFKEAGHIFDYTAVTDQSACIMVPFRH